MKKIIVSILVMTMALFLLTGCNKLKDKIGKEIGENILGDIVGGDVKVDEDGEVTIKGEDGDELTIGSKEWPDTEASKQIPEFKKGKIESISTINGSNYMFIQDVKQSDFESYLEQVKSEGFTDNEASWEIDTAIMFSGSKGEDYTVILSYETEKHEMSITIAKNEVESTEAEE